MEQPLIDCPECGMEIIRSGSRYACTRCAYRLDVAPFRSRCLMPLCCRLAEPERADCADCERARMPKD